MAANPALVEVDGMLCPAPFQGEALLCSREGIQFEVQGIAGPSGKWDAKGWLYLSNVRLVFVAHKSDPATGLLAFDLPLVYLKNDKFNQPIFGCNNLSGECWPACEGGGPQGTLPPYTFKIFFLEGGVGTFLPIYFRHLVMQRQAAQSQRGGGQQRTPPDVAAGVGQAFVDPNDPTRVFLSQPVEEAQRLDHAPVYAANYGKDEVYEPMTAP